MLTFECGVCHKKLLVATEQAGQRVRCPACMSTLQVPGATQVQAASAPNTVDQSVSTISTVRASMPMSGPAVGRRYGFNCQFCTSRLEAVDSMAGQEGTCPTCSSTIIIPILDRYGKLIDPMTGKVIKPDPHPVHAYAAAGERAPKVVRRADGTQAIQCARCPAVSPITANNCKACGMPFTMEGTTADAANSNNGMAVASLVMGIIGVPMACSVIVPGLAIIFGGVALYQINQSGGASGGKGMAIAGLVCGSIGVLIGLGMILS